MVPKIPFHTTPSPSALTPNAKSIAKMISDIRTEAITTIIVNIDYDSNQTGMDYSLIFQPQYMQTTSNID